MKKKNIINIEIEEIIINLMIMKNKLQIDFNKEKIIKIIKRSNDKILEIKRFQIT